MCIRDSYWGGMLKEGATSFWEKYNPEETGIRHLAMYGRPYGKSLCHFIMESRLVYCLQNGLPLDMDVYDLAEWPCSGPSPSPLRTI